MKRETVVNSSGGRRSSGVGGLRLPKCPAQEELFLVRRENRRLGRKTWFQRGPVTALGP